MKTLLLGLDGGGTKTDAVLASVDAAGALQVLAEATGGPSNPQLVGFDQSIDVITAVTSAARNAAGAWDDEVAAACVALAGAGREPDQQRLLSLAATRRLATRIEFIPDANAVLEAGTPDGWGIALIAGTGSLAFGKDQDGKTARAGGWGPIFGDEGSAYQLGIEALRAAAGAADGREPPTRISELLFTVLGIDSAEKLVSTIMGSQRSKSEIASLSKVVVQAADELDTVALSILKKAAGQLAGTIMAVARKLDLQRSRFPLALAGGLLLGSQTYRQLVLDGSLSAGLHPAPIIPVLKPAHGALKAALRLHQNHGENPNSRQESV